MSEQESRAPSSKIATAYLASTSNMLAEILARHREVESESEFRSRPRSQPIATQSVGTVTETCHFKDNKTCRNLSETHDISLTTGEDERNESTRSPPQPAKVEAGANPASGICEPQIDLEDSRCRSCNKIKSKHDFTVEEREKYPDSVSSLDERTLSPPLPYL